MPLALLYAKSLHARIAIIGALVVVFALVGFWLLVVGDSDQQDQGSQASDSQSITQEDLVASGEVPEVKVVANSDTQDSSIDGESYSREVTVTRASYSSGTLTVAAIIDNAESSDECTLRLAKTGQPDLLFTEPLVFQTSYYACKNFSVSGSSIPENGTWNIVVEVTNQGKTVGQSDAREIEI
jgi:hypothetical protein